MSSIIRSSGTSSPLSTIGCTRCPSALPSAIAPRSMSPVRDVREPVVRGDPPGLRTLAGPLDAKQEDVERHFPAYLRKPS